MMPYGAVEVGFGDGRAVVGYSARVANNSMEPEFPDAPEIQYDYEREPELQYEPEPKRPS